MNITPQEKQLVFSFKRVAQDRREILANGAAWLLLGRLDKQAGIYADADWGPESDSCAMVAEKIINRVFEPFVPGYGRVLGWPAMDEEYQRAVADALLAGERRSEFELSSEAIIALAPDRYTVAPPLERPKWAVPGERIRFREVGLAMFSNHIENAKQKLIPGTIYTLSSIECASSSTKVTLLETGEAEFNYAWFDRL